MNSQKQGKKKKFGINYNLIPILFVLCIVPLIMRVYVYDSGLEKYAWYPNRNQEMDIFLYYKGVALVMAAIVMAVLLIYGIYTEISNRNAMKIKSSDSKKSKKSQKKDASEEKRFKDKLVETFAGTRLEQAKWLIPLAAFGFLALLSTLFSKYPSYGFNGIYEQFESIWVILAYCLVTAYTFYFVRTKKDIDTVQKGLFIILFLIGLLGITQLVGRDFWESNIGKSIYVPAQYAELKETLEFNFSGSGNHQVYLTFYNPNYVGVFAALILPICIMLCVGNKKWPKKIAWGGLSVLLFLCALGSGSKAFLLSLVATAFLGIIIYGRRMLKYLPVALLGMGAMIFIVGIYYTKYVNMDIVQYMKNAIVPHKNSYMVEDFIIADDHVTLKYNNTSISMMCEDIGGSGAVLQAWDENGTSLTFTSDEENVIHFDDERFKDITVALYEGYDNYTYVSEISVAGTYRFGFAKDNSTGTYTYMNYAFRPDKIVKAESAIFTDYDSLFSGRGYLWSRTIPLLKKHLLLGSGADTFILEFPCDDYVAKTNAGYWNGLVTKPHSMYLQMAVQYGIAATLCFLAMAVMYAVQTIKLCWKSDFKDKYSCMALGILLGVAGYGIMGISNDSCVALAPMAWLILGLGFAVNQLVKKELAEQQTDVEEL